MWWTAGFADFIGSHRLEKTAWANIMALASLTASMTVNALVTGLIVFKIFKVFREVKVNTSSAEESLGVTTGRKLRSIIFIIIESGMALFAIQLAGLVFTVIASTDVEADAENLIIGIHEMLNVIASSVIVTFSLIMWTMARV
jgi:hypothetical protein